MFTLSFVSAVLLGASAVIASPDHHPVTGCNLANAIPTFPPNQTAFTQPTGAPSFIVLGVGVQNYTCNATSSTYVSTGAVAELLDISCLYNTTKFNNISETAYKVWSVAPEAINIQGLIAWIANIDTVDAPVANAAVGEHYFVVPSLGAAIAPKWDFTAHGKYEGNPNALVIGARDASLPAPTDPTTDIPWLQLHGIAGKLATSIYRLSTSGGQPPTSCVAGSADISVKYTSVYWLYGNTA